MITLTVNSGGASETMLTSHECPLFAGQRYAVGFRGDANLGTLLFQTSWKDIPDAADFKPIRDSLGLPISLDLANVPYGNFEFVAAASGFLAATISGGTEGQVVYLSVSPIMP